MSEVASPSRTGFRFLLIASLLAVGTYAVASGPECADCHEVSPEAFAESVHGFLECVDCHAGAAEEHEGGFERVDCSSCHEDVVGLYAGSIHGLARGNGTVEAPDCDACHGEIHTLVSRDDPASTVHPTRLAETCGTCHSDPEMVAKFRIPVVRPMEAYEASAHAGAVADGELGATCSHCHDSHGIFDASDPRSTVHHLRVSETCGTCHAEITERYDRSVHGTAAADGVREAPVCTDCHGEHRILSPKEPGSPVFTTNIPLQTCGRCHGDMRLSDKYGISGDMVPAYEDSYHGLASRTGVQTVAHCASCHGVHDILPSTDPESHIHEANLAATCGKCHPGAGTRFSIGPVHVVAGQEHVVVHYIRIIYLPLIFLTIGGMVLHNLLDFRKKFRHRHRPAPIPWQLVEERMSLGFRVAHFLTLISFMVLVYTGFALKYPESWWSAPLLTWESDFGLRGWLHRVAAVVIMGALGWHFVHLAMSRRARRCIAQMLPGLGDLREFRDRMAYYFGLRSDEPPVPNVGYVEKAEYLAFMWGMVVMAATGFLLWFENLALQWLPKWASDAATAIHWYEAILASLAILVWHFYWVIFDPVVYPMDLTWLTGKPPAARAAERSGEIETHADRAERRANRREAG